MRVELIVPDVAPIAPRAAVPQQHSDPFGALVDAAGAMLDRAAAADSRFAAHRGGLQEMVVERARADIALQVAATAAQRTAQSLQTLLGMQV